MMRATEGYSYLGDVPLSIIHVYVYTKGGRVAFGSIHVYVLWEVG